MYQREQNLQYILFHNASGKEQTDEILFVPETFSLHLHLHLRIERSFL